MQVSSSMTTRPPEPIIAPAFLSESKSRGRSRCVFRKTAARRAADLYGLEFLAVFMPPPISKMISRSVVPIGTSIRPVLLTLPVRAKALVPGLCFRAHAPYTNRLLRRMIGTLAKVSTLLSTVGFAHRPCSTVRGGLTRGMPRFPSIEAVSALPSPHTNAPAPWLIWMRKLKSLPRIFVPRRPISSARAMAVFRRFTASGYSART